MAPNVLLSYSSSLCKIKIYDCVMLKHFYKSDWYSLTNEPSDPNVEKYFHEGSQKNYYHPNGYINIKHYFIILFFTILFIFNILSNIYLQKGDFFFDVVRKLIKPVTSTIDMDILALASRCYIRTHEIWNSLLLGIQNIYYSMQNCNKILQQLLSSSSQVKSQSNFPSHTIDWCIQGPLWHLNSFSAHLESSKKP